MKGPLSPHVGLGPAALMAASVLACAPVEEETALQTAVPSIDRRDLGQYQGQLWGLAYHPGDRVLHIPIGWMGNTGHVLLDRHLERLDVVPNPDAPEQNTEYAVGFFEDGQRLSSKNDGLECGHRRNAEGEITAVYDDHGFDEEYVGWGLGSVDRRDGTVLCLSSQWDGKPDVYLHRFAPDGEAGEVTFVDIKEFAPGIVASHPWQDRLYLLSQTEVVVVDREVRFLGRFVLEGLTNAVGAFVDDSGTLLHVADRGGREIRTYELADLEEDGSF